MIDQYACELIADGLVDQDRSDCRVNTTRETTDHATLADLLANLFDRLIPECAHRPVAGEPGNLTHEITQERCPMRRMHDLEMELGGVEFAPVVADNGDRGIGRRAQHIEAGRQDGDPVAMAHPHRILFALAPHVFKQRRVPGHGHFGAAKFAVMATLDLAAQLGRHCLLAITNSEDRNARFVDRLRRQRSIFVEDRRRPARQDDSLRLHLTESSLGLLVGNNLGIDLLLPDPARDELGNLGTEIDDQDLVVHGRRCGPNVSGIWCAKAVRGRFLRALYRRVKPVDGALRTASRFLNAGRCRQPALARELPISICRCGNARIHWARQYRRLQAVQSLEWTRAAPDDCRSPAPRPVAARSESLEAMGAPPTALVRAPLPAQRSAALRAPSVQCLTLQRPLRVGPNQCREALAAQQAPARLAVSRNQA